MIKDASKPQIWFTGDKKEEPILIVYEGPVTDEESGVTDSHISIC